MCFYIFQLTQVEETVGAMHETCDSLETRLRRTKELSGKLIQQTDALAKQREVKIILLFFFF